MKQVYDGAAARLLIALVRQSALIMFIEALIHVFGVLDRVYMWPMVAGGHKQHCFGRCELHFVSCDFVLESQCQAGT